MLQIEQLEKELARDIREDKQKQIDEMNRLNVRRQEVIDKRHKIIQKLLHMSVCMEAISQVAQAQQIILEGLEKEYEEGSRAKMEVKRKKDEADRQLVQVKDELRKLKVGVNEWIKNIGIHL